MPMLTLAPKVAAMLQALYRPAGAAGASVRCRPDDPRDGRTSGSAKRWTGGPSGDLTVVWASRRYSRANGLLGMRKCMPGRLVVARPSP